MKDNQKYISTEPGIDVEAAQWLTGQKVSVIGCDNMGVEVLPYPEKGKMLPVHQHTLVEAGVHLIENLVLDELMRQNVTTFCFIMLPIKFTGATASPVRPIAVL
jgi:kynurenine formamidase